MLALGMFIATPAFAQSTPNWNVTLPLNQGHAIQRVQLSQKTLTIDRTFPQNKAHFAVPLAYISHISSPYPHGATWSIDLKLSKAIKMRSTLDIGPTDVMSTDEVSLTFLSKDDAAAARIYLQKKIGAAQ
jgi:hypothetical protein